MAEPTEWTFRGHALHPSQLYELAMAWRPVVGVSLPALKSWAVAADLDLDVDEDVDEDDAEEDAGARRDADWRELASVVDRWVRSPAGRAYGADDRGPALWETHVAGLEIVDIEAVRLRHLPEYEYLRTANPPVAQSLSALADLHPWVAWMETTNRAYPGDVVPRLYVRELGVFAHSQSHGPAWSWDHRLRSAGVDPLGDPSEQAVRALTVLQDGIRRTRRLV
jgi:hypothetical protein